MFFESLVDISPFVSALFKVSLVPFLFDSRGAPETHSKITERIFVCRFFRYSGDAWTREEAESVPVRSHRDSLSRKKIFFWFSWRVRPLTSRCSTVSQLDFYSSRPELSSSRNRRSATTSALPRWPSFFFSQSPLRLEGSKSLMLVSQVNPEHPFYFSPAITRMWTLGNKFFIKKSLAFWK